MKVEFAVSKICLVLVDENYSWSQRIECPNMAFDAQMFIVPRTWRFQTNAKKGEKNKCKVLPSDMITPEWFWDCPYPTEGNSPTALPANHSVLRRRLPPPLPPLPHPVGQFVQNITGLRRRKRCHLELHYYDSPNLSLCIQTLNFLGQKVYYS